MNLSLIDHCLSPLILMHCAFKDLSTACESVEICVIRVIRVLRRGKSMFIRVYLRFLNFKMHSLEIIRFSQIKKAHPINAGKPPAHDRELAPQGREILSNRSVGGKPYLQNHRVSHELRFIDGA
jgi:hypothetical protein